MLRNLCLTLLLALSACASAASSSGTSGGGASAGGAGGASGAAAAGGLSLNITPGACPDAGMPSAGGACSSLAPRSFTTDIVPLFNSCAGEVCHSFSGGAIAEQVGMPSVECCGQLQMIEPGHPERSYVLQKLRGTSLCGGEQMPLDKAPFNPSDLQTISDWICQGARTNP